MWIFMKDAFLSIVDKGGDGSTLLVRGRHAGDIERVFPGAKVERTPARDYLFLCARLARRSNRADRREASRDRVPELQVRREGNRSA